MDRGALWDTADTDGEKDGKWSCPQKKTRSNRSYALVRKSGKLLCNRWNKVNLLKSFKAVQLSLLFAMLLTSQSSAGDSGDAPGHFQQVKCLIYSSHFSDVRALKRRTMLLHAPIFSREQTKNIRWICNLVLRTNFSCLLFSTTLLGECSWNGVLHKKKTNEQTNKTLSSALLFLQ